MNAACKGWSACGEPSPSMVTISSPSCMTASVRQELILRPLISTVQAPHCPWSQPFLVPVRWRCSRSASSSDVRGSRSSCRTRPLTVSATCALFVAISASFVSTMVGMLMANSLSYRDGHAINNDFRIVCSVKSTGSKLCARRIDVRKTSIVDEIRRVSDFTLCFGGVVTKNM
jgi:hypothetical protein